MTKITATITKSMRSMTPGYDPARQGDASAPLRAVEGRVSGQMGFSWSSGDAI
jgi:hypothetical protein